MPINRDFYRQLCPDGSMPPCVDTTKAVTPGGRNPVTPYKFNFEYRDGGLVRGSGKVLKGRVKKARDLLMWFSALKLAAKAGAHVYQNRQKTKMLMADAQMRHAEKMANGQAEYQGKLLEARQSDWKDEFILLLLSAPIALLSWAVFSDDPAAMEKMQLFFEYFSQLPFWYQTIFVGVIASVYGLKATDLIKRK
jgi:hypothetical protein